MTTRQQLIRLVHQVNQEARHASNERDELIQAVRDALGAREQEWFPDGFPASDSAVEAILWLGEQLSDLGGIPSRYEA